MNGLYLVIFISIQKIKMFISDLILLIEEISVFFYSKSWFESDLRLFGSFLGNITDIVQNIMENAYVPPGTNDTDHLAWLQITSDVSAFGYRAFSHYK